MEPLSLTLQTVYADLAQRLDAASQDEATITETEIGGIRYLRLQHWVGETRVSEHLGRADDPEIAARAAKVEAEMAQREERRALVSLLRRAIPGPSPALGKVLDALAFAGLFRRGAVLIGTAAYQCFPPLVGHVLPSAAMMTQDADLATADLALSAETAREEGEPDRRRKRDLESILRWADKSFAAVPGLDPRSPPSRFRAANGFLVDLVTPQYRRNDPNPMPLPALKAGAVPLQHLDWLIEEPISGLVLHGSGVRVMLPRPARFAVHKLIVAQKRPASEQAKRMKDLAQAAAMMEALRQTAPFDLEDALEDARSHGKSGWAQPIERSLSMIARL